MTPTSFKMTYEQAFFSCTQGAHLVPLPLRCGPPPQGELTLIPVGILSFKKGRTSSPILISLLGGPGIDTLIKTA